MTTGNCNCAYCKEGMSSSAEECIDRQIEVRKRLKEFLKKAKWRPILENMKEGGK